MYAKDTLSHLRLCYFNEFHVQAMYRLEQECVVLGCRFLGIRSDQRGADCHENWLVSIVITDNGLDEVTFHVHHLEENNNTHK